MKILFAGGGTAGHINPAIAMANHIKNADEHVQILFVGTHEGLESLLVPQSGYNIEYINVQGFDRSITLSNFINIFKLAISISKAKKIIKNFKPDVVVGTGGYVSGPVLYKAAKMKIPTLIHESNAFAGVTSKILAKYVDIVALAFADGKKYFTKAKRVEVTGNPIRPNMLKVTYNEARKKLSLDERPFIVAFGGSLGAKELNSALTDWICKIAKRGNIQTLVGTGKNNYYESVCSHLKDKGLYIEEYPHIRICEYIYDMECAMNAADLLIVRSGAQTISEITALGKASILIPSPNVTDNHQEYNARAVEKAGGGVVILEKDLSGDVLYKEVNKMLDNQRFKEVGYNAKRIGIYNAADKIYKLILEITKKNN